jgi:hypothetical protein
MEYVEEHDMAAKISLGEFTFPRIHAAFGMMKELILESRREGAPGSGNANGADPAELRELREQLEQRDNEIAILVCQRI